MQSKLLALTTAMILSLGWFSSWAAEKTAGNWETLFDGKSTGKWRGYKRDAFPDKGWKVESGTLKTIVGGDVVDIVTKDKYDNFELELEWKISPAGNSGIMYRVSEGFDEPWHTGPEMEVLDDAKHNDGQNAKTSAGSLYALIAPTDKTLKLVGQWNTTRIVANGNHIEHWLNGKKVVEYEIGSKALQDLIAASKFSDKPRFAKEKSGHIVLQHHTDEVWYRNIRVRRLGAASAAGATDNQLTAAEKAAGWKLLFDGKTTEGWRSFKKQTFPERGWIVEDGVLRLLKGSNAGDIITTREFTDFELEWDWKIEPGGNNGLKYLITEARSGAIGHEYQLVDDPRTGPKHETASFYDVLPPQMPVPQKPPGEWNRSRILVQGNHVEHWLNGEKVLTYELGSPEVKAGVAKSKFKDVKGFGEKLKGHILLTEHHDAAWFKNIKIRELPPK